MALDIDIATSLKDLIAGHSFSQDFDCEFLYDQYVANERLDSTLVRISVEGGTRYRQHRNAWCRDAVVTVVFITPQQVNTNAAHDANAEITAHLDLWDEIVDFIQDQVPNGIKATDIRDFDGFRFDKDKLHSDRQFRAGVAITYRLI